MGNACTRTEKDQNPKRTKSKMQIGGDLMSESATGADNNPDEIRDILNPAITISKDDFHLVKVVGRGTFGKVFLVRKKETN